MNLDGSQTQASISKTTLQVGTEQCFAVDYVDKFYVSRVSSNKNEGCLHHMFTMGEPGFNWPCNEDYRHCP